MNTMMGACRYCGQNQMVNATDSEDADRRATALCKCEDAERARLKRSVDMLLRNLFCDPDGGDDQLYRTPDDEAAPEYDGVFPLDGNLIKLQQLRHRLRRAGGEPPVRPGIHRGERALRCAVHVLFRRDGAQYARLVQRRGQRAQQQYAVYRCIGAQTVQRFFQCHAGNVLRKGNAPRFDAGGGAALHGGTLVGKIVLPRSEAHDGERRDNAFFAQRGYGLRRFFVERGGSDRAAKKHAHHTSLPYTSS